MDVKFLQHEICKIPILGNGQVTLYHLRSGRRIIGTFTHLRYMYLFLKSLSCSEFLNYLLTTDICYTDDDYDKSRIYEPKYWKECIMKLCRQHKVIIPISKKFKYSINYSKNACSAEVTNSEVDYCILDSSYKTINPILQLIMQYLDDEFTELYMVRHFVTNTIFNYSEDQTYYQEEITKCFTTIEKAREYLVKLLKTLKIKEELFFTKNSTSKKSDRKKDHIGYIRQFPTSYYYSRANLYHYPITPTELITKIMYEGEYSYEIGISKNRPTPVKDNILRFYTTYSKIKLNPLPELPKNITEPHLLTIDYLNHKGLNDL